MFLQIIILPFETEHLQSLRKNWVEELATSIIRNQSRGILLEVWWICPYFVKMFVIFYFVISITHVAIGVVSICWVTLHKTSIVFHCELIRIIWLISQSVAVATGEWEMQTLGRWCLFRWFRGREGAEGGFDAKVWLLTTERIYTLLL